MVIHISGRVEGDRAADERTGPEVVGVFMVATLPDARGHGYGSALTWAATVAVPDLPAVLLASDDGRPIYERLGYEIVSRFALWERPRTVKK